MLYLVSAFDVTLRLHWRKAIEHYTTNRNVIRYHLRIIQECFQPKIGRKIRIFSLGRKNKILIKQIRVYADFDFHRLSFRLQSECLCKTFVVTSQNQPKAAKTTQNHQQNQPKRPKTSHKTWKNVLFTVLCDVAWCYSAWYCMTNTISQCRPRVYLSRGHEVISCLAIAPDRLSLIQSWRCIRTLR